MPLIELAAAVEVGEPVELDVLDPSPPPQAASSTHHGCAEREMRNPRVTSLSHSSFFLFWILGTAWTTLKITHAAAIARRFARR
ncbi:hypothetical protein [Burkholderia arboris]|uniref:hypothetical protein n=1 Tax=Burkholderia arboris TaxID=488730 RepID=UPI001CF241A6|nr:hypothetical protein [Burkholderia arboris]MCA8045773.1 hypothetical protein [Burkholderia arboris]